MITTACGIDVTETMLIEFTTGRMTCDFLNAGNYNAAYITPDETRAPKAKLSDLAPTQFVAQTNGDEVRNLANIMDDPDRCVRLWNTYVLPRLLAAAKALNIPLTDPALVPAEICYFILPGNRRIKAWVAPFLIHTGPDISQSDIERFILDTYRGDPSLDIPGGRFLADAIVPGNIIRWHNILVTIDPGSLYTISPKKTLRLDSSHACLTTWHENSAQENYNRNFFRENSFRNWFADLLFQKDARANFFFCTDRKLILRSTALKDNIFLLAAIFYLAKYHPTYLDVEILTQNAALKRACAYLFLQERVFTDLLPNFNATGALSVVKRYFPNISAYSWVDEAENLSHADILKRHENECEKVIIAKEIEATLNEEPNARDSIDVEYKNKLKKIVSTYQHPTLLLRYQNVLFHLLQLEKMHSSETTKTSTTNVKIFYDVPEAIAKLRKHLPKDINDLPSINLKALIPANKIYLLPKTLVTCVENLTAIQKELFNAIAAEEPKKGKKCTML